MMVLRRLFIDRFLYVPLRVQLHALRLGCSVSLSMANLRDPVYSPECVEGKFSEVSILHHKLNAASKPHGSILNAFTVGGRLLHVLQWE